MDQQAVLDRYLVFWRDLTPENVRHIHDLVTDDVRFVDPFQDQVGRAAFERILQKIFHDCRALDFRVMDYGWSVNSAAVAIAYVRWEYRALPHKSAEWWVFQGMSELHFGADGLLLAHIDHWDCASQIFPKFPVLRQLWAMIQRKMRAA